MGCESLVLFSILQYVKSQEIFYDELEDFKLQPSNAANIVRGVQDDNIISAFFKQAGYDRVANIMVRFSRVRHLYLQAVPHGA
jgi:hypothetical protein